MERARLVSILVLILACCGCLTGCGSHNRTADSHNTAHSVKPPPIFEEMTNSSGLHFKMKKQRHPFTIREALGHGAGLIDYDQDGLLDIVLLGPDSVRIYHNDGNWRFTDVTEKLGIRQDGFWQGIAVGDYDNDGYPDLYVCGHGCSALYHNEHGYKFREVTKEAGLESLPPNSKGDADWRSSAAFVDADQDGRLDLYVCRYVAFGPNRLQLCGEKGRQVSCTPEVYTAQKGSLYMNLGNGHFRDETEKRGLADSSGKSIGIAIGDFNGDGHIDIALANDEVAGNLFENRGRGYFRDVGMGSGTALDSAGKAHGGMGIDWGDYDNDGRLDLYITTYENEPKSLYHNLGNGSFMDNSSLIGLEDTARPWVSWGTKFLDYDNDGRLDLFLASGHVMDNVSNLGKGKEYRQPIQLLHQETNGKFIDVSSVAGSAFQTRIAGRGVCVGDLDNDGRPDLLISNIDGPPLLLRNACSSSGHWIGIKLVGKRSNRMGIGSEVHLKVGGRSQMRVCTTTGSALSAHDPRMLFGLASEKMAQSIVIQWPSGAVDTFKNVISDHYYLAAEGEKTLQKADSTVYHQ